MYSPRVVFAWLIGWAACTPGGLVVGGDRPVDVFVPTGGTTESLPLVISLHGYSGTGDYQDGYFGLGAIAEARRFVYAHPDGTTDLAGLQFWNATDACCDLFETNVDDVGYLSSLIDEIRSATPIDDRRIYFVGHSNGGFMSHRMACDRADTIAAIVSFAGATFKRDGRCVPASPVSVLQIHGTADEVIPYDGDNSVPSAPETTSRWAAADGCDRTPLPGTAHDVVADPDGIDARAAAYDGCASDARVELWTVDGASHEPDLSPTFGDQIIDFLFAHPKP